MLRCAGLVPSQTDLTVRNVNVRASERFAPEVFGDISQLRSQRHVRGCRSGQVEFVVWLAQMVAAMPSIFGDQSRIRTGRYVAVVQDGATLAPRVGKPQRAAAVSTSAVITDLGWVN
jgi:hypothetical protein